MRVALQQGVDRRNGQFQVSAVRRRAHVAHHQGRSGRFGGAARPGLSRAAVLQPSDAVMPSPVREASGQGGRRGDHHVGLVQPLLQGGHPQGMAGRPVALHAQPSGQPEQVVIDVAEHRGPARPCSLQDDGAGGRMAEAGQDDRRGQGLVQVGVHGRGKRGSHGWISVGAQRGLLDEADSGGPGAAGAGQALDEGDRLRRAVLVREHQQPRRRAAGKLIGKGGGGQVAGRSGVSHTNVVAPSQLALARGMRPLHRGRIAAGDPRR